MKKYNELMKHIVPNDEQKDRMFEKAISGRPQQIQRKFKVRYCVIAAALAMAVPTTIFADEIKEVFYNLLGKNEIVSEDVLTDIYSDNDGHVKITVKELLSDGINSYVILEYSALDDKGQWWINRPLVISSKDDLSLHINYPKLEPIDCISNSSGVEELTEYHTENSRLFKLTCCADRESSNNSVRLIYNLHDKWRSEAILNVSNSVQCKDVKIDSSLAPEKTYKPSGYKISSLGLVVYGNDLGMVETKKNAAGGYTTEVVKPDSISSLYLVMKDGKTHDMLGGEDELSPREYMCMDVYDYDFMDTPRKPCYNTSIYSGAFPKPVDIDTIAGIELDGVYYPLEEKDLQN